MEQEITSFDKLLDLTGKTAIVTGGAKGIGLGIVTRLAQAGANILIADMDESAAKESADKLSGEGFKVKSTKTNVSNEEDVNKMVATAVSEFGSLDIMVNNAGIYPQKMFVDMTAADFDKVIAVNLHGVFLCMEAASKQMIAQGHGGKIINVNSIDALHPSGTGLAHYDASKHGAWGLTKNAALELSQHNISVNAIAPGGITTPGTAAMPLPDGVDPKKIMEAFTAKIPMHKFGMPDDIGKVALFLASDMSSYMIGSQIVVDGGVLLN